MNDPRSKNEELDSYVLAALERFAELAPDPDPWPLLQRVDQPGGDGRNRWVASAAAAAVGVAGVGAIVAVTGDNARSPVGGAPDSVVGTGSIAPTTVVSEAVTDQPSCGASMPAIVEFAVPFTGPVEASGEALVQRWEFQGGSLELTWPATDITPDDAWNDAPVTDFEWTASVFDEGVPFIGIDVGGDSARSPDDDYWGAPENYGLPASFAYDAVIGIVDSVDGTCDTMQLDVQGSTGNVERYSISLSGGPQGNDWSPTLIGVTVDGRSTVTNAPHAFEDAASDCDVVSGTPFGASDRHAEPIAALASFLDSDQGRQFGLPLTGWQQQRVDSNDDRYWYVQPLASDLHSFTAVVTVEHNADGWSVSGYELTCG